MRECISSDNDWVNKLIFSFLTQITNKNFPFAAGFGTLIAFVGLFLETISDFQKYRFREKNKSGFITTGLWSMSRHPNYLGEVTFWVGLCIAVIGALPCEMKHYGLAVALCVVSPGWSMFFLFFTSLMLLEKRANERWGSKAAYKAYKEKTPILLPVHI